MTVRAPRFRRALLLATVPQLLMLLGASTADAITLTGPPAFGVDTATPTSAEINTVASGTITDLNLYVHLSGIYAREVEVRLIHGTTNVLVHEGLLNGEFPPYFEGVINAVFDDDGGPVPTPDGDIISTIVTPTFQSAELLSAFNGMELAGTWTLQMVDNGHWPTGTETDLPAWELQVETETSVIPEPTSLFILGLAGIAAGVRRRFFS